MISHCLNDLVANVSSGVHGKKNASFWTIVKSRLGHIGNAHELRHPSKGAIITLDRNYWFVATAILLRVNGPMLGGVSIMIKSKPSKEGICSFKMYSLPS
jgi:hypothetical protein